MSHPAVSPQPHAVRLPGVDAAAWPDVRLVETTGSTHVDLLARARAGERGPAVLLARAQRAGRGRLGRSWDSPLDLSLSMSVLLAPAVPAARWAWLPLLTGLAVHEAVADLGVPARLKWPNDVLVADAGEAQEPGPAAYGGRKLAGILVESVAELVAGGDGAPPRPEAGRVVVGIGVNVAQSAADLPVPHATSLRLVLEPEPPPSLEQVAAAGLDRLGAWLARWRACEGDAERAGLVAAYRAACATLGRQVRVAVLPGGSPPGRRGPTAAPVTGVAVDIAADGGLVVEAPDGTRRTLVAGDVEHVR